MTYVQFCFCLLFTFIFSHQCAKSQSLPSYRGPETSVDWQLEYISFIDERNGEHYTLIDSFSFNSRKWNTVLKLDILNDGSSIDTLGSLVTGAYSVSGDKVYYLRQNRNDTIGGLIYDFGLSTGDSVYCLPPNDIQEDSILYVVESTYRYECSDGTEIRVLDVGFNYNRPGFFPIEYNTTWVEGIGDIFHPFIPSTCLGPSCEVTYLNNKFLISDSIYLNNGFFSCPLDLPTSVMTERFDDDDYVIAQDHRGIVVNKSTSIIDHLSNSHLVIIYNINGQVLVSECNLGELIETHTWPPGIYFLTIQNKVNSSLKSIKFVVR